MGRKKRLPLLRRQQIVDEEVVRAYGNSRDKGVDFGLCSGGDPPRLRAEGGEKGVRGIPALYGREGRREPLSP